MNKVALVTGASRGVGNAIAKAFASKGFRVAGLSRSIDNSTILASFPSIAPEQKHHFFSCDVSNPTQVNETVRQIEKTVGPIDLCVNAAGVNFDNLLVRMKDEQIHQIINTNLLGSIFVSKAVARGMIQRNRGHIINIGSVVGIQGNAGQSVYSASKSGLSGFTKSLSKELGGKNIMVNLIAPGFIDVGMTQELTKEQSDQVLEQIPLKRFGTTEDVTSTVLFLASSNYITGQIISVDGGLKL